MTETNPAPAIEVRRLFKHYGDFEAVSGLDFQVIAGRCTAFLGPNGAGKTSTIKTLYGKARADQRPDTLIRVLGYDMPRAELAVKSLTGVVPQDNCLDEELDIESNLYLYSRFYGMKRAAARARITELLEFMELTEKRHNRVKELSGGMQRRLVIARALLNNPRLLILDEPTTGLDPQVRQLIWNKLRTLMREGVTILLTTHYMDEAWQIADDIIIMDKGKIVLQGPPQVLMAQQIETHVLEVLEPLALSVGQPAHQSLLRLEANGSLRRENSGDRSLLYSSAESTLESLAQELSPGSFLLRRTNLEDLFLKSTGRALND